MGDQRKEIQDQSWRRGDVKGHPPCTGPSLEGGAQGNVYLEFHFEFSLLIC